MIKFSSSSSSSSPFLPPFRLNLFNENNNEENDNDANNECENDLMNYLIHLHCPVCYCLFSTPMMLINCSHNYCSICIRRTLIYRNRCPQCNIPCSINDIKPNRLLDYLVQQFNHFKQSLVKNINKQINKANQIYFNNPPVSLINAADSVCSPSSFLSSSSSLPSPNNNKTITTIKDLISRPPSHTSSLIPNKVHCPICFIQIATSAINQHLDGCLAKTNNQKEEAKKQKEEEEATDRPLHLQTIAYNLYTDKQMKELLKKLNLPINGNREELIKRHKEYLLLCNSSLDSMNPLSPSEIIKIIIKNEKDKTIVNQNKATKQNDLFSFTKKNNKRKAVQMETKEVKKVLEENKMKEENCIDLIEETDNYQQNTHKEKEEEGKDKRAEEEEEKEGEEEEEEKEKNKDESHEREDTNDTASSSLIPDSLFHRLALQLKQQKENRKQQRLKQNESNHTDSLSVPSANPSNPVASSPLSIPISSSISYNNVSDWRAVWSISHNKIFYYNTKTKIGQFDPPHTQYNNLPPFLIPPSVNHHTNLNDEQNKNININMQQV